MNTTIRVLLIDPFQKRIHELQVKKELEEWQKLLDCDCLDHAYIGNHQELRHDIWVDDVGLDRYPMYPTFKWTQRHDPLIGYGLLTADAQGETISTPMPVGYALSFVSWEAWERRLKPEDFFEQLLRIYIK